FSPDGATLASASNDGTARLWEARTGEPRATLVGHTDLLTRVLFSPDGSLVATASHDGTVRLWDGRTGAALRALRGLTHEAGGIAFSPDGRLLAAGTGYWWQPGEICLWNPAT